MLTEAYEDNTLSRACVLEWHQWFSGGRDGMEEDEHAGHSRQNGESAEGPSKTLIPELSPLKQHQMQRWVNAKRDYLEDDNVTKN
ncbi:hypothetical protein TNCV_4423441 [Trichonephila clavipes]|nr:hypothetical protein TNCV_4423441 [Trichonephila clavipes]